MDLIPERKPFIEELKPGENWRKVKGIYKKGRVFDQTKEGYADPNYCAGCVAANMYEIATKKIESGKAIYNNAKNFEEKISKSNKDFSYGTSFKSVFSALSRRQKLKDPILIDLKGIEEVMSWLVAQGPVGFGGMWTEGMVYPTGWWRKRWMKDKGPNYGNHASTIIGTHPKGYLVIENSWGYNWGNKALGHMKWTEFEKFLNKKYYNKCVGFKFS